MLLRHAGFGRHAGRRSRYHYRRSGRLGMGLRLHRRDRTSIREFHMKDATEIVRFEDVTLNFGEACALDRVSFHLGAGETIVVFGAAGSGKTSLLKVAVGLVRPDSGRVYLMGQE